MRCVKKCEIKEYKSKNVSKLSLGYLKIKIFPSLITEVL